MRLSFALIAACLTLYTSCVSAADVNNLNSARVPVADRSDTEFKRGIAKALEAVIVKLTGSSATARTKRARAIIGHAKRLIQQFGYERPRGNDPKSDALILRVEFDARVLGDEMRARNLVVWGKERPDTLVWLVVDDGDGRRLLGAEDDHALLVVIKRRALARGIPLVFPLGDITESSAVGAAASASQIERALSVSSETYGVQSVLTGYLHQVLPGVWENQWQLRVEGESLQWEQQGDFIEILAEEATDSLADALGRRYAAPALYAQVDVIELTVKGVASAADYARTERYLRSVDSVSNLMVRRVSEQGIVFDLAIPGGLAALSQIISFGQTLSADPGGNGVFRLKPK